MRRMTTPLSRTLQVGRTTTCQPAVSSATIDALIEEHGLPKGAEWGWNDMSRSQMLDCIATQILANDRRRRVEHVRATYPLNRGAGFEDRQYRRKVAYRRALGGILMPAQFYERTQREVLFKHLDFLDRRFSWEDWHWDDGGWYGDAPLIIQEVLPALYDGMARSQDDFWVGVWWSPPRGTRGAA